MPIFQLLKTIFCTFKESSAQWLDYNTNFKKSSLLDLQNLLDEYLLKLKREGEI